MKYTFFAAATLLFVSAGSLSAQVHPAVPAFSSLPGAAYTVYLDFGGFTFNGNWGNSPGSTPDVTPAYDFSGNASTPFTVGEQQLIQNIWSRTAEKYAPFNVNVTTVDPAVAAGQAANDTQRQNYYDSQARMMHTVIGGPGGWTGGGGVSYVGVTANAVPGSNGYHTDWVFSAQNPTQVQFVAEAAAHENGHGLTLWHQSDYSGTTLINEYSAGTGGGLGTLAPIMGNSYTAGRGTWKVGTADNPGNPNGPTTQNDVQLILSNPGLGNYINDSIGHSLATATPLPLSGLNVNSTVAKGIIVPASNTSPNPTGVANYTSDFWSFTTIAGLVSLKVNAGRSTITPGVADPGATLDATLKILDASGSPLFTADTSSLSELLNVSLSDGTYYAQILSRGSPTGLGYYDMGSYFLSGSLAVPEPSTWMLLAIGAIGLAWRSARRALRNP